MSGKLYKDTPIMGYPQKEQEPKTEHCKGCKWRKNRDEVFKRGVSMESLCASCYVRNKE